MYRLWPADHRLLFLSKISPSPDMEQKHHQTFDSTGSTSAWQVSQLLTSIRSINTTALSYLPLPANSSEFSKTLSSSNRAYLHAHELSTSVLYLDEGVDTLIGCEAIGGK